MNLEELKNVKWNKQTYKTFISFLKSMKNEEIKNYNERTIPNVGPNIGIDILKIREIAEYLIKNNEINKLYIYLDDEEFYEGKLLQGRILPYLNYKDTKDLFNNIDLYIFRINNWSLCDNFVLSLKEKILNNKESFFLRIRKYIRSKNPWEVRFGLNLLKEYFIDEKHIEEIFLLTSYVTHDTGYVTDVLVDLLIKCYFENKEITINYIKEGKLDKYSVNKFCNYLMESQVMSKEEKNEIKELKKSL